MNNFIMDKCGLLVNFPSLSAHPCLDPKTTVK